MKKNIYFLLGMFSFGALFASCNDDDFGKAVTITVENATNLESDIFGVVVTEGQPLQLKPFIMPESARANAVSYHFAGEPTGAIDLSEDGLITPKLTTPAEGAIPSPLGTDTIIVRVDDGSDTYVKYPVRVISNIVLVSSITIQSAGQSIEAQNGKTFNLAQYVTINPSNATDKSVTYISEDPTVATVDQNGIVTIVGETGQSTEITVTANDRGKQTATARVKVVAEAPMYVGFPFSSRWSYSSNIGTKEGDIKNLFDDKNSTFWCPDITTRPIYDPVCYLDINLGEVIKFGQLGYRHRSLNYPHLQCHTFKLEAKKVESDAWTDLGEFVTEAMKVDDYQLFPIAQPIDAQYIRITFIKGHLRDGMTDWNYSESGNVSVGDLQVFVYNR